MTMARRRSIAVLSTCELGDVAAPRNVDHDELAWVRTVERVETRAKAPNLDPNDWIGLRIEAARATEHVPTDPVGIRDVITRAL